MKFPVLCLLSLILCSSICQARAKAPESPKILFTSAPADNYEVYIMNPDGTEQVNLTQHRANDLNAVWSPTGEQILFVSDRDGVRDLYLMDTDGSDVRRVLKKEIYRDSPTWSPDGQQIAYTQMHWDQDKYPIYIATLEAQEEALGVDGLFPAWSPDGTEIAYVGFRFGGITFINVRTRKEKRLVCEKPGPRGPRTCQEK